MNERRGRRRLGIAIVVLAAIGSAAAGDVFAQGYGYPQSYPAQQQGYPQQQGGYGQQQQQQQQQSYPSAAGSPVCTRLEAQLAAVNRGGDPVRAEQIRRYEDAIGRQQNEVDRMIAQSRRLGCEDNPFLSLFSNQPAECRPLGTRIQELRAEQSRTQAELQRIQGGNDIEGQRQAVVAALAQNNCGPQYQAAVNQQRGLFGDMFGSNPALPMPGGTQATTFRTLCVRTCDGYYFPISFQTTPSRFAEDEASCKRLCPAAEVQLFTHRNPGEEVGQSVSLAGQPYRSLPAAFKYRQSLDPACSCRKAGQSWADALGVNQDTTVERGDIIVTEERSKAMAAPRDAQGRPIRATPAPAQPAR